MVGTRRHYRVYGQGGETIMHIDDGTSPYLESLALRFPEHTDRALRHIAWWLRGVVKQEMRASAPAGRRWKRNASITKYRVIEAYKKARMKAQAAGKKAPAGQFASLSRPKGKEAWPEAGRLTNAVGYQHPSQMNIAVGWLSRSAARLGVIFQGGQKRAVTHKMRHLYAAAGVSLSGGKSEIEQPARPVFSPIFEARKVEIRDRVEKRIDLYLTEMALKYQLRATG
jgi:hypothetical protein